ncbi:glycosyltransferase family 2 protein [Methylophilaceae bacterium]|nr:glycosyltransferase family 2 protein [Methylophilaceae bacterium]
MTSLSIIIPAYNEERAINKTVENSLALKMQFPNIDFEIIVIDDGSFDNTYNVVKKKFRSFNEVRLIKNQKNLGLGSTIKKGIKLAKKEKFIFIPGDNDLPKSLLIELIKNINKADIITTFFINDEIRGRFRNLISQIFLLTYTTTFNIFLKYINGPAIYPTKKLKDLKLKAKKFSIVAEINIKLISQGLSFKEIAGHRQNNDEGSSAVSFGSFIETIYTYLYLVYEVKIYNRRNYKKISKRII